MGRVLEDSLTSATIIPAFRSAGIYSRADMDLRLSSLPIDQSHEGYLMSQYTTSDYILTEMKSSPATRKEKRREITAVRRRKGLAELWNRLLILLLAELNQSKEIVPLQIVATPAPTSRQTPRPALSSIRTRSSRHTRIAWRSEL